MENIKFKVCYLNARSLNKHINHVRNDFNLCSSDLVIFTETRFLPCDPDDMYIIDGYQTLFRNDSSNMVAECRPFEFIVAKVSNFENYPVIGVYRSPQVSIRHLCMALNDILSHHGGDNTIILGDFNINWTNEEQRRSLYTLMIENNGYQQLISRSTTDYNTLIDHVYSNVVDGEITPYSGIFEA